VPLRRFQPAYRHRAPTGASCQRRPLFRQSSACNGLGLESFDFRCRVPSRPPLPGRAEGGNVERDPTRRKTMNILERYAAMDYDLAPEARDQADAWIAGRDFSKSLFIGGAWRAAASGATFDTHEPA